MWMSLKNESGNTLEEIGSLNSNIKKSLLK